MTKEEPKINLIRFPVMKGSFDYNPLIINLEKDANLQMAPYLKERDDRIAELEKQLLRVSLRYKKWRKAVFKRDRYTCQICGDNSGGNLCVHHIKSFALYPKHRFKITNGRTLCLKCHKETENYGFTKENGNAKRD